MSQQFPDRPAMIGDPRGHRGRPLLAISQGETRMQRAEVVQRADEIHPRVQQFLAMHQMLRPPRQRRQACPCRSSARYTPC